MHVSAVLLYSDGPSLQGSNRFLWKVAGSGQCATHAADGTSNAEITTLTWAICGWGSSQRQNARLTQNATNPTLALRSTAQPRAIVIKYSQAGTRPQLSSPSYLNARASMFMSVLPLHGRDPSRRSRCERRLQQNQRDAVEARYRARWLGTGVTCPNWKPCALRIRDRMPAN